MLGRMFRVLAATAALLLFAPAAHAQQTKVSSITITPAAPRAGEPVTIGFTLKTPAPAGGSDVWVRYDDPWWQDDFSVPDTHVIVPEGQSTGSARMPVEVLPRTYQSAKFTVLAGSTSKAFTIQARPDDGLYRILSWTAPPAITYEEIWGATVTLDRPTPPEGLVLGRIERIIPPGVSAHTFVNRAPSEQELLNANAFGAAYAWQDKVLLGAFSTAYFDSAIIPLDRPSMVGGYGSATVAKPLVQGLGIGMRAPAEGTVVTLTVSDPRWHVPATLTVPAGAPGTTLKVYRDPGTPWLGNVTVTATWPGGSVSGKV